MSERAHCFHERSRLHCCNYNLHMPLQASLWNFRPTPRQYTLLPHSFSAPKDSTAMNASCGTLTVPIDCGSK